MKKIEKTKVVLYIFTGCFLFYYLLGPNLLMNKKQIKNISIHSGESIGGEYDSLFHNIIFNDTVIFNDQYHYSIYLTNSYSRFTSLTFLSYKSFGVTRLFSGHIIIAPSNLKDNLVIRNGETNKSRSLSSVIKHECAHKYIRNKYGFIKNLYYAKMQSWKIEGYCEYIAQESSFGFSRGISLFVQEKTEQSNSFDYFKYRLYVQYLLDYKGLSFDEILETDFDINTLETGIRNDIINNTYNPPII